jgi:hypothetical protein
MPSWMHPRLVLVWALVAGLPAGGAGLVALRGTDFWALPDDGDGARGRAGQGLNETVVRIAARCTEKHRLAAEVIEGRLGLLEAARHYRDLDEQPPPFHWEQFRHNFPGRSDDERHCRQVIAFVRGTLPEHQRADPAVVARLEAELEDLRRQGDLRLPRPVAALPEGP